jgi:hypothetical protein
MEQSSIGFREVLQRHCREMKPQKGVLVAYLLERKFEPKIIELVAKHFVLNTVMISGVDLEGEFCLLETLQTKEGRDWVQQGFLPIGTCPNGDRVVLDIQNQVGSVRYVCHETDFDIESPDASLIVASSLGEFAEKLEKREIGSDFFQESCRSKQDNPNKIDSGD